MGYYYNPPQELPEVARRIEGHKYEQLKAQLKDGERLFGHYDRLMFQNAVYLFSAAEMEEFESQVRTGLILRLGFYAMSKAVFDEYFGDIREQK